jgi:hypothetical protein
LISDFTIYVVGGLMALGDLAACEAFEVLGHGSAARSAGLAIAGAAYKIKRRL